MNWHDDFVVLNDNVSSCKKCQSLCKEAIYPTFGIFPENLEDIKIMFLGQAPAKPLPREIEWNKKRDQLDSAQINKVYSEAMKISRFGKWVHGLVTELQLDWKNVGFTNFVKCYPTNHQIVQEMEDNCLGYVKQQMDFITANVYVTLGSYSLMKFTDGEFTSSAKHHATSINYKGKLLIPSVHPSFLFRHSDLTNKKYNSQLLQEIKKHI